MRKLFILAALITGLSLPSLAETIHVGVNGLVCSFCATGIENSFKANPAIESVKVDLDSKLVTLNTKPDKTLDDAAITKTITDAGYSVTDIHHMK
jgi:copper chaperone CopZ